MSPTLLNNAQRRRRDAINAADAVCGARLGHRAAGEDHDQVLALLRKAGPDGTKVEFKATVQIDTPVELEYYKNGGILHTVVRMLAKK